MNALKNVDCKHNKKIKGKYIIYFPLLVAEARLERTTFGL